MGSWDFELPSNAPPKVEEKKADDGAQESEQERVDAAKRLPKDKSSVRAVRLIYRHRSEGYDEGEKPDPHTRPVGCVADGGLRYPKRLSNCIQS